MTEDKSMGKIDHCLRLFSSRRQSPLLVHLMPRIRYCCAVVLFITHMGRVVAEWLRLLPSVSKVAGSIPVCVPRSDVALLA